MEEICRLKMLPNKETFYHIKFSQKSKVPKNPKIYKGKKTDTKEEIQIKANLWFII